MQKCLKLRYKQQQARSRKRRLYVSVTAKPFPDMFLEAWSLGCKILILLSGFEGQRSQMCINYEVFVTVGKMETLFHIDFLR